MQIEINTNYLLIRYIFNTLILISGVSSSAQQIQVSGKVTDTLQNPLAYANILAIPSAEDQDVKFAVTENDGTYKL